MASETGNSLWVSLEGETLDGVYVLRTLIGEGTSGGVYLADHIVEGVTLRRVAVKLIAPKAHLGDRQLTELSTAASLRHPYLITCFHAGSATLRRVRLLFLVMELAEGSLEGRLKDRSVSREELVCCARQIAEALTFLHGRRITHRDVKPANILSCGGDWKLADYGAVRGEQEPGRRTQTAVGTPLFMAPEALEGVISPAGDLWSYGATLLVALTGRSPYLALTEQGLLDAIRGENPIIPVDLDPPLAEIIRGCLIRDPRSRWTSEDVLAVLSSPPETSSISRIPMSRWIKPALAVVTVLIAIEVSMLVLSVWIAKGLEQRLRAGGPASVRILTHEKTLRVGDAIEPEDLIAELRTAGLSADQQNPAGWYAWDSHALRIVPAGRQSTTVDFENGRVSHLREPNSDAYSLPPLALLEKRGGRWAERFTGDSGPLPEYLVHALGAADEASAEPLARLLDSPSLRLPVMRGMVLRRLRSRFSASERIGFYGDRGVYGQYDGGALAGLPAAVQAYFSGKPFSQLTLSEAALLGALLEDPVRAEPSRHPSDSLARRNALLERMRQRGWISALQARRTAQQPLPIAAQTGESALAPAAAVVSEVLGTITEDRVTTLDAHLQAMAEEQLHTAWERTLSQGARSAEMLLVAVDNASGELRALASFGAGTFADAGALLRPHAAAAVLQPLLAAASTPSGTALTPVSVRWDDPGAIGALNDSAALQLLRAQANGASGSAQIAPLDLAAGFAALANGGIRFTPGLSPAPINSGQPVWDQRTAYLVSYVLRDTMRRLLWPEDLPAVESATGVAEKRQSVWFAGSRGAITCVIWMRSEGAESTLYHEAARAWAEFLNRVPAPAETAPPPGIVLARIDRVSGLLATTGCPDTTELAFVAGTEPTQYCTVHGRGAPVRVASNNALPPVGVNAKPSASPAQQPAARKGLMDRLRGVFHRK